MAKALHRRLGMVAAATVMGLVVPPLVLVGDVPGATPDAVVSLASHEWERLPAVADLSRAWPGATVVLTVPSERVTVYSCTDCGRRPAWLNYLGVDGRRIAEVPLGVADGTWGEALAVVEFARQRGWRRILVVTSAFHTRRALMTFRRAAQGTGIEIGVQSAEAHSALKPSRWFLSLEGWWYVTYESAALVKYAWLGRLAW